MDRKRCLNKKGQGLSTNTIILLVLGVVVLVVLILGFTMGWESIAPWIPSNNVENIVDGCQAACSTNSKYDFCSFERELKDADGNKFEATCNAFANVLSFSKYGIDKCSNLCEPVPCEQIKVLVDGDGRFGVLTDDCQGREDVSVFASDGECCIDLS